jgi:hypothetical protein
VLHPYKKLCDLEKKRQFEDFDPEDGVDDKEITDEGDGSG